MDPQGADSTKKITMISGIIQLMPNLLSLKFLKDQSSVASVIGI